MPAQSPYVPSYIVGSATPDVASSRQRTWRLADIPGERSKDQAMLRCHSLALPFVVCSHAVFSVGFSRAEMPRPSGVTVLSVRTSPAREASANRASGTRLVDREGDVRLRLRAAFTQEGGRAPLSRFALRLPLTTGWMLGPRCSRLAWRRVCLSATRRASTGSSAPEHAGGTPEVCQSAADAHAAEGFSAAFGDSFAAVICSCIASSAVRRTSSSPF